MSKNIVGGSFLIYLAVYSIAFLALQFGDITAVSGSGDTCANKTKCAKAHGCLPHPSHPLQPDVCFCNKGYKISDLDPGKCEDYDECQSYKSCSQKCTNLVGSFECSCIEGFHLLKDNTSCWLNENNASLVYTTYDAIKVIKLFGFGDAHEMSHSIRVDIGKNKDIVNDARESIIYWINMKSNGTDPGIWQSRLDGTQKQKIFDSGLEDPNGLAFDWITKNIYFSDVQKIVVCSVHKNLCSILIDVSWIFMDIFTNIAVHPNQGFMFWTTSRLGIGESIIMRAGMDGSYFHEIVTGINDRISGFTVDHASSRIYWITTSFRGSTVYTGDLHGHDVQKITFTAPFTAKVHTMGNKLFWSDGTWKRLQGCDKSDGSNCITYASEGHTPILGFSIIHQANQPIFRKNDCLHSNCTHICTLTSTNSFSCKCPVGMEFLDSKTCFENPTWPAIVIGYGNTLKKAPLGSIGRKVFDEIALPEEVESVQAISYNPIQNSIIFSDNLKKKIFEFHLNNKKLSILVEKDVKSVGGFGIDIIGENLYWVDSEKRTLEVMCFRSLTRRVLAKELYKPTDIIIIPDKKELYIAEVETEGGMIVKFSMNGHNRQVIYQGSKAKPTSLAFTQITNELFWADHHQNGAIQKAQIYPSTGKKVNATEVVVDVGIHFAIKINKNTLYWTSENILDESLVVAQRLLSPSYFEGDRKISVGYPKPNKISFMAKFTITNSGFENIATLLLSRSHPCSSKATNNSNPCSHMCLLSEEDLKATCMCPEGFHLDKHGHTCVPLVGYEPSLINKDDPSVSGRKVKGEVSAEKVTDSTREKSGNAGVESIEGTRINVQVVILLLFVFFLIGAIFMILGRHAFKTQFNSTRVTVGPYVNDNVEHNLISGLDL